MNDFQPPEKVLNRLAALCARSEQCTADIEKKLDRIHLRPGDRERIMARLKELKFVDDQRFARAYCHDKLEYQSWGRIKIARGLWAKRISRDMIDEAIGEIDSRTYMTVALRSIKSKIRQMGPAAFSREGRDKLLRFMAGRGFETQITLNILSRIESRRRERLAEKGE